MFEKWNEEDPISEWEIIKNKESIHLYKLNSYILYRFFKDKSLKHINHSKLQYTIFVW